MSDETIQIVIAVHPNAASAETALKALEAARRDQGVDVMDAVVVSRKSDGKLAIHETQDVTGGKGAAAGGILGGVIGLLAGPAGVVAGAAVGAAVGGAAAGLWDTGIPHKRLTEIGQTLTPGTAALVVLTAPGYVSFIETVVGGNGVNVSTEAMDAEAARKMGHDHEVANKALNMGDALAEGGLIEIEGNSGNVP